MRFFAALALAITSPMLALAANPPPKSGDNQRANLSEWRLIGLNDEAHHFTPLAQINDATVKRLGVAWFADMPTPDGMVGVPLVADGMVYQSGARSIVYANDVRTGKLLWSFDPQVKLDGTLLRSAGALINRGLALWEDAVFVGTGDCRVVAVDRKRGRKLWEVQACDDDGQRIITGAPRVSDGKVFIGNANGDFGTRRGHVDAFDAMNGQHLWRFFTIPGDPAKGFESAALARAAKTWGHEWWSKVGGGSVWEAMTYDPVLKQLYIGVGGASPFDPNARGKGRGDELYTNSIVALNAETGEYVWHYQTTPADAWNYEPTMHIMVADLPMAGGRRRVVMEAAKNGFFYVLDARSGKLLSARNFVPVNWASHVDSKSGRPVELAAARWYGKPDGYAVISPSPYGAHSWQPMGFSPATGLVYLPALVLQATVQRVDEHGVLGGALHFDYAHDLDSAAGRLIAWDPVAQKPRWSVKLPSLWNGGALASAGNLVFQGTASGEFRAYDARSGTVLWSMQLGSGVAGAPSSVDVDGAQYVLLPVGSGTAAISLRTLAKLAPPKQPLGPARLIAFKLDGTMALPRTAAAANAPFAAPPRRRYPKAPVQRGAWLYESKGCELCHGVEAVAAATGAVPDLRRATEQTHAIFAGIVLGGLYARNGMPSFGDAVTPEELEALQAYIIDRAWDAYETQGNSARKSKL